jgi:ubiquinone/menaquinone biosynthesis C-methylase UbiE
VKRNNYNDLTPVSRAQAFDSEFRRWLHNPQKIIRPFISKGMTILDLGCGPGFFSIEMAKMIQGSGKIIAADLQEGMIEILRRKIHENGMENLIQPHRCTPQGLNLNVQVDFILAFYVIHEITNPDFVINELKSVLKPGGKILIAEQKMHVPRGVFNTIVESMIQEGFKVLSRPHIAISRAVLMEH